VSLKFGFVLPFDPMIFPAGYDDVHGHTDAPYYDDGTYGRYSYSRPVTPHALTHAIPSTTVVVPPPPMRHRTHSGVSYVSPLNGRETYSHYRHGDRPGNLSVKFKRKGAFMAGIGLDEAQSHIRLSNNDAYSLHDLHADSRGRILLKVKVNGFFFSFQPIFVLSHVVGRAPFIDLRNPFERLRRKS